jgi:hypothetical protein
MAGPYPRRVKGSVTVHVAVPPGLIWDLVGDVIRIGEFSPETFEAQWRPTPRSRWRRGHSAWPASACSTARSEQGRSSSGQVVSM